MIHTAPSLSPRRSRESATLIILTVFGAVLVADTVIFSYLLAGIVMFGMLLATLLVVRLSFRHVIGLIFVAIIVGPLGSIGIPGSPLSLQIYAIDLVVPILVVAYIKSFLQKSSILNPRRGRLFLLILLLMATTIPSLAQSWSITRAAGTLRYTLFAFLTYILLLQWKVKEDDIRLVMKLSLIGGGFFIFFLFVKVLLPTHFLVQHDIRVGTVFFNASINYTSILMVAFALLALATAESTGRLSLKIAALVITVSLALLSIMTGSRSAIIGLFIGIVAYSLQRIRFYKIRNFILLILLLVFLVLMLIWLSSMNSYYHMRYSSMFDILKLRSWNALLNALPGEELYWGDWYRVQIWTLYIENLTHRLWFGNGLGGMSTPYFGGTIMPAHNFILELLSGVGVVGSFVYIMLLSWAYIKVRPSQSSKLHTSFVTAIRSWFWALMIVSLLQPFMTTGYQAIFLLWVFLALGSVDICQVSKKR